MAKTKLLDVKITVPLKHVTVLASDISARWNLWIRRANLFAVASQAITEIKSDSVFLKMTVVSFTNNYFSLLSLNIIFVFLYIRICIYEFIKVKTKFMFFPKLLISFIFVYSEMYWSTWIFFMWIGLWQWVL